MGSVAGDAVGCFTKRALTAESDVDRRVRTPVGAQIARSVASDEVRPEDNLPSIAAARRAFSPGQSPSLTVTDPVDPAWIPWDDSWDERRPYPCAMRAFCASACGICAGRTPGAAGQPTLKSVGSGFEPLAPHQQRPRPGAPPVLPVPAKQ
jgi:hypothetical protein